MESYQVEEWGKPLRLVRTPTPVPTGAEVLVRVSACGVCHSDAHIREGYYDMGAGSTVQLESIGIRLPVTMGHEIVGVVEAAGPQAGVEIGMPCVVYPWIGCGECRDCRRGRELDCMKPVSLGTRRPGGYSDHVLVPNSRYVLSYEGVDSLLAATSACAGLTAYSAVKKVIPSDAEDTIVVIGAGGLGLAALDLLKVLCPSRVVVVDRDIGKLKLARERADAVYSSDADDICDAIRKLSGGGVRAVLDFVGLPATMELGISVLAKGGSLIEVGLFGGSTTLSIPLLPMRNLKISGSYVGTLEEMRELLDIMRERELSSLPLIARPMAEINSILTELSEGRIAGRVIVRP